MTSISAMLVVLVTAAAATSGVAAELISGDVLASFRPVDGWRVVGQVDAVPGENRFVVREDEAGGSPVLLNCETHEKIPALLTKDEYGDVEVCLEFCIPKNSNSGVFLMGRYEIQILDSSRKGANVTSSDLGGIYQRWRSEKDAEAYGGVRGYDGSAPLVNASRPPGEWQEMRIVFRAPRFGSDGKKIKNAVFELVEVNGQVVQKDAEVEGPTRGRDRRGEVAAGPLDIQGNHGPIAIRSLIVRSLD
ncbi:MAG: DUF1080 domain-containing protein [Planctomycetota bacterium]